MAALPKFAIKVLDRIASQCEFIDYEVTTKAGSKHGDNFLGVIIAATLKGTRTIGGEDVADTLHLLVKIPPDNRQRREQFNSDLVFDRELHVYTKVLPALTAFQKEKGLGDDELFSSLPKVYACEYDEESDTHILVMENLRARNFDMWPKEKSVPVDHMLLLMEALGKFHGASFALKDQRPTEFDEFKKLDDLLEIIIVDQFYAESSERATASLRDPAHKELVTPRRFRDGLHDSVKLATCDRFGVVTHGDCWINNMMFQYPDVQNTRENVTAIALVDWQLCRYCSPALDLLYLFGITDKALRDKHYEQLLRTYHSALSRMICRLGSDPDTLFTFDDLQSELRRCGEFALFCTAMILQVRLADSADVIDLDSYAAAMASGDAVQLVNKFSDEVQAVYDDWLNGAVADLVDFGYVKTKQK